MQNLPDRHEQIIQTHSSLIRLVVHSLQQPDLKSKLHDVLKISADNGWVNLVGAIRKILAGDRSRETLLQMDEEDRVIVTAILDSIEDPLKLPEEQVQGGNPSMAAPGLAHMIQESATGNTQALSLLANMAEQMSQAGGDMRYLGGIMKRLVDGERNADVLCKGMGAQGRSLVLSILDELGKLQAH